MFSQVVTTSAENLFQGTGGRQSGPAETGDIHLLNRRMSVYKMLMFSQLVQACAARMGIDEAPFPTLSLSKKKTWN